MVWTDDFCDVDGGAGNSSASDYRPAAKFRSGGHPFTPDEIRPLCDIPWSVLQHALLQRTCSLRLKCLENMVNSVGLSVEGRFPWLIIRSIVLRAHRK
jgi:hypothetical protein